MYTSTFSEAGRLEGCFRTKVSRGKSGHACPSELAA